LTGVKELIPTYRSLLIDFDPSLVSRDSLQKSVLALQEELAGEAQAGKVRLLHFPVCYGGEYGPDLAFVAEHHQMKEDEVIAIHTSVPYLVYMLGFTPGFPYLGGMSEKIATPRLAKPRTAIPAGSVGIAGSQTGFYPIESPGGWQLIGRTPLPVFAPESSQPFVVAAGDYLLFESVSQQEYQAIVDQVTKKSYQLKIDELTAAEIADLRKSGEKK
ncbi:MAG: 5-oxoprolinase subunit PxpB, partial [Sporomusaceae bacterium]|nr:5-oxoprolinase subunit PxpB [Sporomusaceae bacterium]